jgi:Acetyltransferase (GNAT) domain
MPRSRRRLRGLVSAPGQKVAGVCCAARCDPLCAPSVQTLHRRSIRQLRAIYGGVFGEDSFDLETKVAQIRRGFGGAIDWKECRTPEEIEEFFPLARKVSAITYQERRFHSGLPNTEAFIAAARESSKIDKIRAYLLCFNKDPISYLYCPIAHGVVLYNYLGYDPAYAALSPGTVLQFLALQALFAERRFAMFDFTEGEGQHKKIFSTQNVLCGDVFVLNRRLAPLAVVTLHRSVAGISTIAGAALDRLRLKSRVRRLLRQN